MLVTITSYCRKKLTVCNAYTRKVATTLSNTLILQTQSRRGTRKVWCTSTLAAVWSEKNVLFFSSQFTLRLKSSVFFYPWFPYLYKQPSLIIVLTQHISAFPKQERKWMSKKLSVHHKRGPKSEGSQSVPYKETTWEEKKKPNTSSTQHELPWLILC